MTSPAFILVISAMLAVCVVCARVRNKLTRAYAMRKWGRPDIAPLEESPSPYEQAPSPDAHRPVPFRPSPLVVTVALSVGGFVFLQVLERSPMTRGVAPVAIPIVFGVLGLISYRTRRQWWKDWAESQSRRHD
jgi:hypothetical protein